MKVCSTYCASICRSPSRVEFVRPSCLVDARAFYDFTATLTATKRHNQRSWKKVPRTYSAAAVRSHASVLNVRSSQDILPKWHLIMESHLTVFGGCEHFMIFQRQSQQLNLSVILYTRFVLCKERYRQHNATVRSHWSQPMF